MSSRPLVQLFWTIKPLPIWRSKLVQQAIGSAAGPTVGGRIKPLPDGEDQACPAGHWSSCWTQRGLKENAPTGKNKLVQQAINPAAGPIAGWRIQPFPNWENKLVQQAIGPAAGPIVGWRIKPFPNWEEQACPAGHWSSCWTHCGLEEKPFLLGRISMSSRPLVQLLDP